jgi:hypothetical protein
MPIPSDPAEAFDVASTLMDLFGQAHDQIRDVVTGLDDVGLNWAPTAGANSIATIITHAIGSEAETIRSVVGIDHQRDRDAEFSRSWQTRAAVTGVLDEADLLVATLGPRIDGHRLATHVSLPTLPPEEERSGLTWLMRNYGHLREHVGQIQLTGQLYRVV